MKMYGLPKMQWQNYLITTFKGDIPTKAETEITDKLISKMRNKTNALKDNPERNAIIDDDMIKRFAIRELLVDNYCNL